MPSQENLKQKQAVIDEIGEKMGKAAGVVVIDYIGISVDEANAMRVRLREAGVDYKVYKNTLVKRAIEGTPNESLTSVLAGPSAFAFGYEDATAPARVIDGVIRDFKKMGFKAGLIEGVFYDADGIKQIATIPSRDILIAKFLGSIQSPLGKLVRTFAAIADERGGGEPAAEAAETPAEEAAAAPAAEAAEAPAAEAAEAPAEEAAEAPAAEAAEAPAAEATEAPVADEEPPSVEEAAPAGEEATPPENAAEEAAPPEDAAEEAAPPEDAAEEIVPVEE